MLVATIKDIAKKCGVGTTTVSRVINNSSSVAESTKQKVLKAMKELNYEPSFMARALAADSTYTIGLIMDNTIDKAYANPFIYEIFRGIEKEVYENGYNLLLLGEGTYQNGKSAVDVILQSKRVDGIIIPCRLAESGRKQFEKYNVPIVAIGKPRGEKTISWVDIDNFMAGYEAAKYLYSRGYIKLAFERISEDNGIERDRYLGYEKFIKEKSINIRIFNGDLQDIDAVICLNNITAFKMMQLCKNYSRKIPEDIGLITFDNYPLAEYLEPKLTNVEINLYELGKQAALEILNKVNNKENNVVEKRIPVSINVMGSTK